MTDEQFTELRGMVEQNCSDTAEIRRAITGDSSIGYVGIAERLGNQEEAVKSLQSYKNRLIAWAAGASTAAGGSAAWLVSFFSKSPPPN